MFKRILEATDFQYMNMKHCNISQMIFFYVLQKKVSHKWWQKKSLEYLSNHYGNHTSK